MDNHEGQAAHSDIAGIVTRWSEGRPGSTLKHHTGDYPIRLIRVLTTHPAIFRVHDNFIYKYGRKTENYEGKLKCFVTRGDGKFKEEPRMQPSDLRQALRIMDLQVTDSGRYKCTLAGTDRFSEIYVIVLPRPEDVKIVFSSQALNASDQHVSDIQRRDELNRPFLRFDEKLILNCIYYLSKGLDNFRGVHFSSKILKPAQKNDWRLVRNETANQPHDMFFWIQSYELTKLYSKGIAVEHTANCDHSYKPIQHIVRHEGKLAKTDTDIRIVQNFVASLFKPPVIFNWGINTNQTHVTSSLQNNDCTSDGIESFTLKPNQRVPEGEFNGSFHSMHYRSGGWTTVWSIVHFEQKLYVENCSVNETVLKPQQNKRLFQRPDVKEHYGPFVLTEVNFQCVVLPNVIGIVLIAFNTEGANVNVGEVENAYAESLINVIKERLKSQSSKVSVKPSGNSVTRHRLVRVRTGWAATVTRGQQIVMIWDTRHVSNGTPYCEYRVNESIAWSSELPSEFKLEIISNTPGYRLYKTNSNLTDSGQYRCFGPDKKTSLGPVRTVAVVPASED
ncbi:unnamed protein product, partial [Echinostoma caproni]|uniref:Ig-like domain-containing protein n=1 Tax=Echinostoma caproni TaxID=27848 RepID=A0A183BGF0_9TREM